jgi:hypothetical protein
MFTICLFRNVARQAPDSVRATRLTRTFLFHSALWLSMTRLSLGTGAGKVPIVAHFSLALVDLTIKDRKIIKGPWASPLLRAFCHSHFLRRNQTL